LATGDLPGGRADSRRRNQAIPAWSLLSRHQGSGRYRTCGARGNVRTAADEYVSRQMPATGNAGGETDSDGWADASGHEGVVGKSAEGPGRFILPAGIQAIRQLRIKIEPHLPACLELVVASKAEESLFCDTLFCVGNRTTLLREPVLHSA